MPPVRVPSALTIVRDEQGSIGAFMALSMLAFLGISALAIDLSRQATAEYELAHSTELACKRYESFYRDHPGVETRRSAALRQFNAQSAALGASAWGPSARISGGTGDQELDASASGSASFARLLGVRQLSVNSHRTCLAPTPASLAGTLLFQDGFEDIVLAYRAWTVVQKTVAWRVTDGAALEIQAGTVTPALEGVNFAELDSEYGWRIGNPGKSANSAITTDIRFRVGYFELRYLYRSRTARVDDNIIDVYLDRDGEPLQTHLIDEAVFSSEWEERVVPLRITVADTYHLTFKAAGVENTTGGLIDNIRIYYAP
ncbi:MAG: hypothetical protein H6851_05860 [Geminicoccaceae bacterium]|nr:hypothetical protein [Geminicoccaceae bacterium]